MNHKSGLQAPFLRRIWMDPDKPFDPGAYPFSLPFFRKGDFEFVFDKAVTIIVGENGTGKSTLLEAIAGMIGFDQAGGGNGYRPVDHSQSFEKAGDQLSRHLRASWLPKTTAGWFFKAETFFSVARYLDFSAMEDSKPPPDFLSHSHGEGFLRFFEERCRYRGIYIFDEPESALSPARQIELLKIFKRIQKSGQSQVIMATHSPLLMALPGATLLAITRGGFEPITFRQTSHFDIYRAFIEDPEAYLEERLDED
jgi:predicted ATPase